MQKQRRTESVMTQQDRETFIAEFNQAVKEEQIKLFLQPRFDMHDGYGRKTGEVYGAEVLSRWEHPQKGLLTPKDFLPQCEECDLMGRLDYYVWEHACMLLAEWQSRGLPLAKLSVKVSKDSLYNSKICDQLLRLLAVYKVPKACLQLEIEEDSLREDIYQAQEAIHYLHESGFTIILDDFSYGCSSVSALNQIDVDIIKVDMKFFCTSNRVGKGEVILAGIIKSVSWLGIKVLAECVETEQQNEFARLRGCDVVQGFFFSKPMPASRFEESTLRGGEPVKESVEIAAKAQEPANDLTILVIDDTEMERALLEKYLKNDFHIQLCESAEEGLDYLKDFKNQVNLILVDYMMPGMNGIEFLRFCQLDERLKSIPKIMITSNERAKDQVQAFRAGAYDYLLKPLLPELVQVRVRHAMELNHKLQETEQEKKKYQHQAELDKPTGIWNKTTFQNYVERSMSRENAGQGALFVIDIDNFKHVNDTQGHLMGDEVIKLIASKLSSCFRATDHVGRFGGDEFTVYMTRMSDKKIAEKKAKEILEMINGECQKQLEILITVSIGIGLGEPGDSFEQLFARADEALYRAKNTGKGKFILAE